MGIQEYFIFHHKPFSGWYENPGAISLLLFCLTNNKGTWSLVGLLLTSKNIKTWIAARLIFQSARHQQGPLESRWNVLQSQFEGHIFVLCVKSTCPSLMGLFSAYLPASSVRRYSTDHLADFYHGFLMNTGLYAFSWLPKVECIRHVALSPECSHKL